MGVWRRVGHFLGVPVHRFDSTESAPRPIDQVIWEMAGRNPGRVSRTEALTVPAMQRGRNLICSVGTLPLVQRKADNTPVRSPLLEQIDPNVANVVTLAMTLEDLVFDSISWWEVLATDAQGYPVSARHLDLSMVSIDPPNDGRSLNPLPGGYARNGPTVWIDGTEVPASRVIRFDSPNPGVLTSGATALRRAIRLDKAASMYAEDPKPQDYFSPAEGADPADDDEILKTLNDWKIARQKRATAWVSGALKYNEVNTPNPQQLQLVELQSRAALDVANMLGVDPEELGVSTTSRVYSNVNDRRIDKINDVKAPYMLAITQRLSMGDVTRRGHRVEFDLRAYLKPNPTERWNIYKIRKELGVIDGEGIQVEEGEPPLPPRLANPPKPPAPPTPPGDSDEESTVDEETVNASRDRMHSQLRDLGMRLSAGDDGKPAMTFAGAEFAGGVEAATVDVERRTITGLALPYNKIARKYGLAFRFKPGSLDYDTANLSRIKHLKDHYTPVGIHTSVRETSRGPMVKLKVLDGPEGSPAKLERDQLLYDADHGLYDGLSVGVDFSMDPAVGDVEWNERDQVYDVLRATWRETSSTPMPAFDDARVTKVAASRSNQRGSTMECAHCGQEHAPGVACPTGPPTNQPPAQSAGITLSQEQLTTLLSQPGAIPALVQAQQAAAAPASPTPEGGLTLSADQVQGLIKNGGLGVLLGVPQVTPPPVSEQEKPTAVDPTARRVTASTSVREELPYRFDRKGNLTRGATYDFSTDLISGAQGNGEAASRAQQFLMAQAATFGAAAASTFDTDTTDVATLNPNRNRPDMYVDQKDFSYPIWDAISKGTLTDKTPFVLPKFNSASGLVATHTEGVEPTAGALTTTSQTITPTATSGKAEITREAWDAGGNPQISGIIWRQMVKSWFEGLEAASVTMLDALTPTGIPLSTAAVDSQLVSEFKRAIAGLQFVRGGMTMRDLFLQIDLYQALVDAKDDQGRSLLSLIGSVNADGSVSDLFADLNIGGLRGRPAWALAATGTVSASSYLFDRSNVHGWASPPNRLQFEYQVKSVEIGVWGYKALACTDITGVREITYDPTAP